MIKKFVSFSVVIFFVVVTAVFVNGFIFNRNNTVTSQNAAKGAIAESPTNTSTGIVLSPAEIGKHNNVNDCWLLVGGKIYNVTSYIYQHPGNADTIIPYCGKESSEAFANKGANSPHSSQATSLLNSFFIGNLNDNIKSGTLPGNPQTINNNGNTQYNGNKDDYDED